MEQARQVVRGAKRREGAKPWGRNVTGGLGPAGGKWLCTARKTLKGKETSEGAGKDLPVGSPTGKALAAAVHG